VVTKVKTVTAALNSLTAAQPGNLLVGRLMIGAEIVASIFQPAGCSHPLRFHCAFLGLGQNVTRKTKKIAGNRSWRARTRFGQRKSMTGD
jgi:hypothetical protein